MDAIMEIFTIGHSNRTIETFLSLVEENNLQCIIDVRNPPSSRTFPHFMGENLKKSLNDVGVEYLWLGDLGGHRPKQKNFLSPNTGWTVAAFRNYADHMMRSAGFTNQLQIAVDKAKEVRSAMMCSEAVPWRCHRRMLTDHFINKGWTVTHIVGKRQLLDGKMTEFASVNGDIITYPKQDEPQLNLFEKSCF